MNILNLPLESLNLRRVERGVLLGDITICGVPFYVEAIQVREDDSEPTEAVNSSFQSRIDNVGQFDEGSRYQCVPYKGKRHFIVIYPNQQ